MIGGIASQFYKTIARTDKHFYGKLTKFAAKQLYCQPINIKSLIHPIFADFPIYAVYFRVMKVQWVYK